MSNDGDLRLLRELLESRMRGLRVCNRALEHEVPENVSDLIVDLRDSEVELISRLQRTIEVLMEEV